MGFSSQKAHWYTEYTERGLVHRRHIGIQSAQGGFSSQKAHWYTECTRQGRYIWTKVGGAGRVIFEVRGGGMTEGVKTG